MRAGLHPEAVAVLEAAATRVRPSVHLMPVSVARDCFERESTPISAPPHIQRTLSVTIAAGLQVRLYRHNAGVLPVVLFFHGGGWVLGSIDTHDQMCRMLVLHSGCAVVSVDYRRAPEHPYPAAIDDAATAHQWVQTHAREHGLDSGRLAVAGDSAGGNIAVALASRCRNEGTQIRLQLLFYPVTTTDLVAGLDPDYDGIVLCRDELAWHQDQYLPGQQDRRCPEASPMDCNDLSGMPEAVIIAAQCDPIAPQSRGYAEALTSAGIAVDLRTYAGMIHGFAQYPDRFESARVALTYAGKALAEALYNSPNRQAAD